ncbi:MAG TPA: FimV/HubP family polar landmark protein [Coxiellaceae bacterium]|nr:MAG: hypothetical protein A3E81_06590 [Gammaproteobacteria bacterium RIFCSPHIGHO2_12_FULL_36_30]HLB56505.1 FimV/HubP family polar landmark protein [Coxiellaceae bacterium]
MLKKIIVLFALSIAFNAAFSVNSPFSTAPAPTQTYQSTQTAEQPAPDMPVLAQATPVSTPDANSSNPNAVFNSPTAQSQALNENFQQTTDQHIQNLDSSNQAMGAAIETLDQNVAQLQQEVLQLQPANPKVAIIPREDLATFIIFGGVAALLLLFGVFMGRLMNRSPKVALAKALSAYPVGDVLADDTKSEYDFMGTKAAIPAKLDLARSYMAMNDHEQARAVLKTVLEKGDEEQRIVAEALLTKINKAT